jgi:RNA polymerase sigma-70 factor (ECF subfamily)
MRVLYLVFNEGYAATSGADLVREDLCTEAIRLGRILCALMPDEPEPMGLLALMLLIAARRPARTGADGSLIPLPEQDRSRWDRSLIHEGQAIVRVCLRRNLPGPYQLQAAINAVHSDAPTAGETDWLQILALYDQLVVVDRSPVAALNRAVAVAEVRGPEAGLAALGHLAQDLDGYYLLHAVRADMLRRAGDARRAADEYGRALQLTDNGAERAFLARARDSAATGP